MARKVMQRNYDSKGNLVSKECSKCHEIKSVSEFNKDNKSIDGLKSKCKQCDKQYYQNNKENILKQQKQYNKDNKKKRKQYYQDNKEYFKDYRKQYYQDNKEYLKEKVHQYYQDNAESIKEHKKQYRQDNAESIKEHKKQYRQDNKEYFKDYHKQYYQDNKEHFKEYKQKYYQDNKEHFKEYKQKYYQDNAESISEKNKKQYIEQIKIALKKIKQEIEKEPEKYNYNPNKNIHGIIYLVHNIESDKYYVGQTTIGFDNRYNKGWLYEHSYKDTVKHDLQLYGEESFEYIKIFKVAYSQYELDKLEAYYIDYYNSFENGYNENRGNIFTDRGKEK